MDIDNKIVGYCLTIKDSIRHSHMIEKLRKVKNLNYEFVYAKSFNKDFVTSVVDAKHSVWNMSQFSKEDTYIQRAYSCSDGHRRIMEKFLNQNEYDWALVMEDDLDIDENIINDLNYIINNNYYDWYHLSTQSFENYIHGVKPVYKNKPTVKLQRHGRSTLCYLVNKKFAIKYYKDLTPIKAPSDMTMWCFNNFVPCVENINLYFSDDQKISMIGKS